MNMSRRDDDDQTRLWKYSENLNCDHLRRSEASKLNVRTRAHAQKYLKKPATISVPVIVIEYHTANIYWLSDRRESCNNISIETA